MTLLVRQSLGQTDPRRSLEQIRTEYAKALARLEARFATAHGMVRIVDDAGFGTASHHTIHSSIVEFAQKPGMYRSVRSKHAVTRQGVTSSLPDIAGCFNKEMSFTIEKSENSGSYVVKSTGGTDRQATNRVRWYIVKFLDAPFTLMGNRISDFLKMREFTLERAVPLTLNNKPLLKLFFSYRPAKLANHAKKETSTNYLGEGWILVSPGEGWVMYQQEVSLISSRTSSPIEIWHMKVEYEDSDIGTPLPKRVEYKVSLKTLKGESEVRRADGTILHDGDVTQITTFECDELHFEELPDSEFTLAAFGLPELGKPETPAARASNTVWYFLAAFVALVLAVALKYYASRAGTPRPGEAQG
jgi:hypothetical protein